MSLSKEERQVWNELERTLADDLPQTDFTMVMGHGPVLPPSSVRRVLLLFVVLVGGVFLFVMGALAHLLSMAVAGLVLICVATHYLQRSGTTRVREHGSED